MFIAIRTHPPHTHSPCRTSSPARGCCWACSCCESRWATRALRCLTPPQDGARLSARHSALFRLAIGSERVTATRRLLYKLSPAYTHLLKASDLWGGKDGCRKGRAASPSLYFAPTTVRPRAAVTKLQTQRRQLRGRKNLLGRKLLCSSPCKAQSLISLNG